MKVYSACLLGILGSVGFNLPATGAEVVLFQFRAEEVQINRQDFEAMAQTGTLPSDVTAILGENFQIPQEIRQLLFSPIPLPDSAQDFLDSETGEFLLKRLDRLISSTSGQESENLAFLKSALTKAAAQQQVSVLELIRQYPQATVKIDLTGIEQTYQQVIQFVDDIKSESNPTRQLLANLLCNCPQANHDSVAPAAVLSPPSQCQQDARDRQSIRIDLSLSKAPSP